MAGTVIEATGAAASPAVAAETLPRTGSSVVLPLVLGLLLVGIGVMVVVVARRPRRASATTVIFLAAAALAAVGSAATPASAQVVDPCAPPAAVISEAPLAVLLPASALVLTAGFVLVNARRRQTTVAAES